MRAPDASPATTSRSRTLLVVLFGLLFALYVAPCAYFYFLQDRMAFPAPSQYPATSPLSVGMPFEDLHIPVNRSEQIHCWWIPGNSSAKTVLLFHGNGYVLEQGISGPHQGDIEFLPLHRLGVNLLLVDYRGYGSSSPTTPNEKHVYEDARAAFAYLTVQRGIPNRDIVLFGRSIGSGPATQLAAEHPEAAGLILISPFSSVTEATRAIWYLRLFPFSLLSHNKFDNLSKIASVRIPVFIAVGSQDTLTPPTMAQALFQRANEPKQLFVVPGTAHDGIIETGWALLQKQMTSFLDSLH